MLRLHSKFAAEGLAPLMRSAAIPAALGTLLFASSALTDDGQSAPAAEEATLPELPANLARGPMPSVAPPINRKKPELVHVELEAKPVTGLLADGVTNIGLITAPCLA